ncbi:hypothetical protein thsps21_12810 [Pseudomonas sp. No.21]|uniref:hypothetical protein n=1 Tax=Pseudomonas tohonis TaxID=2725477 RepID=UPI001F2C9B5F|nr:hypothetical protein [Pseudomonas tohonis]GJN44931.1 hypothetical protein TUM20249_09170 [Pseudomonas tohonis]
MTALQRKERPIIFSGSSVRGILDDRKWATRRVVKGAAAKWLIDHSPEWVASKANELCPYGQPGDRLWVRETHSIHATHGQRRTDGERWGPWGGLPTTISPDGTQIAYFREGFDRCDPGRWCPSIHMPRWASRILLEITDVRVERLQTITEEQAKAEGLRWNSLYKQWGGVESHPASRPECPQWRWYESPITAFSRLWESINGVGSWDANPMVWVVEFRRIQP